MTNATIAARESYELVAYPGHAFAHTHPDRLATVARLFGMTPAPVENCRVLELGCTDGGNLIPMAHGLPRSTFLGIDLSQGAIAQAKASAASLQLENVEFRAMDILDFPENSDAFDFIIAHGVYSWVPEAVREKILAICNTRLAPHGVACISYNAYPGCHFRDLVRGMMLFHVRDVDDCTEKAGRARGLLDFILHSKSESDLYRAVIGKELEHINDTSDATLYHDELGDVNQPFYFHEFAAQAAAHGLQFLGEAEFNSMHEKITPRGMEALRGFDSDIIAREQYLDFVRCRRFRQTLLCRADVPLERNIDPGIVRNFHLASCCKPKSAEPKLDAATVEEFEGPRSGRMATDHPLAKAAVLHLGECWPQALTFPDLLTAAQARLCGAGMSQGNEDAVSALERILFSAHTAGLVELHSHSPRFTLRPSERPAASPIARRQIEHRRLVTNLRHCSVEVDGDLAADLLRLLDGTRDREALLSELKTAEGLHPTPEELEENLAKLGRLALLIG
jgi:methyltransferase-like protein